MVREKSSCFCGLCNAKPREEGEVESWSKSKTFTFLNKNVTRSKSAVDTKESIDVVGTFVWRPWREPPRTNCLYGTKGPKRGSVSDPLRLNKNPLYPEESSEFLLDNRNLIE